MLRQSSGSTVLAAILFTQVLAALKLSDDPVMLNGIFHGWTRL